MKIKMSVSCVPKLLTSFIEDTSVKFARKRFANHVLKMESAVFVRSLGI